MQTHLKTHTDLYEEYETKMVHHMVLAHGVGFQFCLFLLYGKMQMSLGPAMLSRDDSVSVIVCILQKKITESLQISKNVQLWATAQLH
jgi:hypothetical protein